MRFNPDSDPDEWLVPAAPALTPAQRQEAEREQLINDLLRAYPSLTREQATEMIDAS
jgi:hypothetical protein